MTLCLDCGIKVSRREYIRCKPCATKFYRGENSPFYKGGKYCLDCGKKLSDYRVKRCKKCAFKGELNHSYGGGRGTSGIEGYILIYKPDHPHARKKGYILEHRYVMEQKLGRMLQVNEYVDHINGNVKDNRIENLRLCTRSQNAMNQKLSKQNTSGYKGVSKRKNKWMTRIKYKQKSIYIGTFDTKEQAAKAYNKAAKKLFGEFARLNNI